MSASERLVIRNLGEVVLGVVGAVVAVTLAVWCSSTGRWSPWIGWPISLVLGALAARQVPRLGVRLVIGESGLEAYESSWLASVLHPPRLVSPGRAYSWGQIDQVTVGPGELRLELGGRGPLPDGVQGRIIDPARADDPTARTHAVLHFPVRRTDEVVQACRRLGAGGVIVKEAA